MRPRLAALLLSFAIVGLPTTTVGNEAPAEDLEAALQTMAEIRTIAVAWEAFAIDHDSYLPESHGLAVSSPEVHDSETLKWSAFLALQPEFLREMLEPVYVREMPLADAWGQEFEFRVWLRNGVAIGYAIRSLGADGQEDSTNDYEIGPRDSLDSDLVYSAGHFIAYPARALEETTALKEAAAKTEAVLELSGYTYKNIADDVWELEVQSEIGQITISLEAYPGVIVVFCEIVERQRVERDAQLLAALLELSNDVEGARITMDEDAVFVRMDVRPAALDAEVLKYIVTQVRGTSVEAVELVRGTGASEFVVDQERP
jgi:hypothetical protein